MLQSRLILAGMRQWFAAAPKTDSCPGASTGWVIFMPATKQNVPSITETVDGYISAFDDLADTIANPPANKPLRAAIGRSGQRYCDAVGSTPGTYLAPWIGQGLVAPLLCKPYWDANGYSAPVATNPFSGGQCVGQLYELEGTAQLTSVLCTNANSTSETTINLTDFWAVQLEGPVTDISWVASGGTCQGLPRGLVLSVTDQGGARTRTQQWLSNQTTFGRRVNRFAPVLVPVGGSDDCGDPPGGYEPGANPPPTPTFPPGEEPGFEDDGQPYFFVPPVDNPVPPGQPIDVPGLDPPGGGGESGPPPGDQGEGGAGGTTGEGGEEEGEAPPGKVLVGLKMDLVSAPAGREVAPGVYRGGAYIYMGGDVSLDQDFAGALLSDGQFVYAEKDNLTRWRVAANIGFDWNVTPYYREAEE